MKKCYMCKKLLEEDLFHKSSNRCKICTKQYKKTYRDKNLNKIKQNDKEYRKNNKEYLLNKQRKYRDENREIMRVKWKQYREKTKHIRRVKKREYEKIKREQNIEYRLKTNVSTAIRNLLKGKKNKLPVLKYLEYSMNELKNYLESLFNNWMTWDNYGRYDPKLWDDSDSSTWTWQIDHIIPHSEFHYNSMEEQLFKDCWALSNLRPYSAKQNILDGISRIRHNKMTGV